MTDTYESIPMQPKAFVIQEQAHPLSIGRSIFRVYYADGTPLYMSGETADEAERKLRKSKLVSDVQVIYRSQE